MKIVHLGLIGPFNEDMSYQGNMLPRENKKAGHDVTIIANCFKWEKDCIIETEEEDRILNDGIRLIRLKFKNYLNKTISEKIRRVNALFHILETIKPDSILMHDLQTVEILTLTNFKKKYPNTKIYADSHTDQYNSANSWISLKILHKTIYRHIISYNLKTFEKIFYISYDVKDFLNNIYKIPEQNLEFFPLGGTVISKNEKFKIREGIRKKLSISDSCLIFIHSGKMDKKKKTIELIEIFKKTKNSNFRLLLIGTFEESIKDSIFKLISGDSRIIYLGWKSSEELIEHIAASDLYLQPGSQSATMQNALCVGTPVLFENVKSHKAYMDGNAFAIDNIFEIKEILTDIENDPCILSRKSNNAFKLANDMLDYSKLATRITI